MITLQRTISYVLIIIAIFALTMNASAQLDDPDAATLAEDNNIFAFDLYQQIKKEDGNIFYSPYSISQAMAMVYAGAHGDTASQMSEVLRLTLPQDDLHPAFAMLQDDLNSREDPGAEMGMEGERFQLSIANALWGQVGYPFLQSYTDLLDENYSAGLQQVDFMTMPEEARQMVNDWVAEQTEDRIKDIVPEGAINAMTRLVLANAIYFNASWNLPFPEFATSDAPFTLLNGEEVTVPMMKQQENYQYGVGEGYQAVLLSYIGGDVGMLILLPDDGEFESFEATLDAETYDEILASLSSQELLLGMPRLEYEFNLSLSGTLVDMGMVDAFNAGAADFSGMANLEEAGENLFISDVLHKAFVKVDESGTEAAAATVVIMEALSAMPEEPIELTIDRPFIFTITDLRSDSILFIGRVLDPS